MVFQFFAMILTPKRVEDLNTKTFYPMVKFKFVNGETTSHYE